MRGGEHGNREEQYAPGKSRLGPDGEILECCDHGILLHASSVSEARARAHNSRAMQRFGRVTVNRCLRALTQEISRSRARATMAVDRPRSSADRAVVS